MPCQRAAERLRPPASMSSTDRPAAARRFAKTQPAEPAPTTTNLCGASRHRLRGVNSVSECDGSESDVARVHQRPAAAPRSRLREIVLNNQWNEKCTKASSPPRRRRAAARRASPGCGLRGRAADSATPTVGVASEPSVQPARRRRRRQRRHHRAGRPAVQGHHLPAARRPQSCGAARRSTGSALRPLAHREVRPSPSSRRRASAAARRRSSARGRAAAAARSPAGPSSARPCASRASRERSYSRASSA